MKPHLITKSIEELQRSESGFFEIDYYDSEGKFQCRTISQRHIAEIFMRYFPACIGLTDFQTSNYRPYTPLPIKDATVTKPKGIFQSSNQKIVVRLHELQSSIWKTTEPKPTTANEFHTIAAGIADVLTEKNKRYGGSALNPINVFSGKTKVGQRMDDKISRIQNSDVLRKNDVADLIGYLLLTCKENNWTDFKDQID
ncbi:MAG: hypothetical protein ABIU30_18450 [Ferruginibacter sp.]